VNVEIWSDLVCPWCYIGQARFRRALDGFAHRDDVQVTYRSFELDPAFPPGETVDVLDMLNAKYGLSADQAAAAEQRVAALAAAEDLPFEAKRPHGNTLDAHRVIQFAATRGLAEPVLDALFRANFGAERSIFDRQSLAAIGADAGLDAGEVADMLNGEAFGDAVRSDERHASELGISGVPFFVANGRLAVSGAQVSDVMGELLTAAWQESASAR
jgi:predicted DsbA family dithiol-disulfide isomerase